MSFSLAFPRRNGRHTGASASLPVTVPSGVWMLVALLGLMALIASQSIAATNTGTALQAAFTAINDMVNGYGKQLLIVIGFAVTAFAFMASNATGVIMKFIGYSLFLGMGLTGALTLVGATV